MNNMRKITAFCFCLFAFPVLQAQVIVLNGIYQGSDVYVQNPFSGQGVSFCVYEVEVNGKVTSDEVNSSAFAIDMQVLGMQIGEAVEINIKHKDDCEPRVLNPEALKPRSTFEVLDISADDKGLVKWKTTGEAGELPYFIEQFKWNKWVVVGEVNGIGSMGEHEYTFQTIPHSGGNMVRVRQTDYTNKAHTSESVSFAGPESVITFEPKKTKDFIQFSGATQFEIFDKYGNLVKKGFDKTVDVQDLEKEEYYLNYDISFGETFIKK
jgi:hypothetical protein